MFHGKFDITQENEFDQLIKTILCTYSSQTMGLTATYFRGLLFKMNNKCIIINNKLIAEHSSRDWIILPYDFKA